MNMHPTRRVFLGRRGFAAEPEPRYDEPAIGIVGINPFPDIAVEHQSVVGELDFRVPWVTSADEFANLHLSLELRTPIRGSIEGESSLDQKFAIWQQNIGGNDFVRFSEANRFEANRFEPNARGLARQRDGRQTYVCDRDADVLLTVDERSWVIITRIR